MTQRGGRALIVAEPKHWYWYSLDAFETIWSCRNRSAFVFITSSGLLGARERTDRM